MVSISKSNLICMNCGFELRQISIYWLKQQKEFKCPACNGVDTWKKIPLVSTNKEIERVRERETWKKLLIAQNKTKFVKGDWKLTKNWKAYNNWVEEMQEEYKHNKKKLQAVKLLNNFVDPKGMNYAVKKDMEED